MRSAEESRTKKGLCAQLALANRLHSREPLSSPLRPHVVVSAVTLRCFLPVLTAGFDTPTLPSLSPGIQQTRCISAANKQVEQQKQPTRTPYVIHGYPTGAFKIKALGKFCSCATCAKSEVTNKCAEITRYNFRSFVCSSFFFKSNLHIFCIYWLNSNRTILRKTAYVG